ncbi:hypothetical protein HC251_25200 (plasmid) [Iamia sp. SCSIO 61187]|uniref:hypothetical protein n=1 Tax=Iamia sp. SCSIO 61187 TaxID=2722752 RepID=UPI001C62F3C3|nr:hypothetical protein [Iamia sp. SCSIO 61187]QYG95848.1 hypothetical protein HC251_25200 [Iamia sp. SCSIO 61187]
MASRAQVARQRIRDAQRREREKLDAQERERTTALEATLRSLDALAAAQTAVLAAERDAGANLDKLAATGLGPTDLASLTELPPKEVRRLRASVPEPPSRNGDRSPTPQATD